MTAVQEKQDLYFKRYAELEKERAALEPPWLREIRSKAIDRFGDVGFPTTHDEEWRFTNVAPIARTAFGPAQAASDFVEVPCTSSLEWITGCHVLAFVNGRKGGVRLDGIPSSVTATSLADGLRGSRSSRIEPHLARYASSQDHAFVALNTALFEDGAFIEVAPNAVLEKPLVLLFLTVAGAEPAVTHPRSLIVVGAGAQASFVEVHLGVPAKVEPAIPYFTNAVTELVAGANAVVDYTRVQQEAEHAYHIGIVQTEQGRSSSVTTHSIALGGRLDREEVRAVLNGEGAEAVLNGLYVIGGHQHVDNHTLIDHAKPHCASREVYKGVLDGHAAGVFNGKIAVRKDAQKTDSKQSNKNLLLSENATINTKPQLEIYADDVRCTHGATIGQIDPEAVFYLRSRGIGLAEARNLLIEAFAGDLLNRIKFEPLRANLWETLAHRLDKTSAAGPSEIAGERLSLIEEGE